MSTLIGSALTNLQLTSDTFSVHVSGQEVFSIAADPMQPGGVTTQYATVAYVNSRSVNDLAAQTADYDCQGYKITGLGAPVNAADAATKQYVDDVSAISEGFASLVEPTSGMTANQTEITNGSTPLNMNSQLITALGTASAGTDGLNRDTADSRYYSSSATLNDITAPTGSLSMAGNKITGLADPTSNSDAATKGYIDVLVSAVNPSMIVNATNADSKIQANQTELLNGTTPLNMNSQKITSLADATSATDALNRQTADGRYYQQSVTLDAITAPTGSVSLNSHKIVSLADATSGTDALNRQTADGRYYANTTTLDHIEAPTSALSLNTQKITNLATPTTGTDGCTKGYADTQISAMTSQTDQIMNATNTSSKLVAGSTELLNGDTPLNMNSQKITGLASATSGSDALSRTAGDARYYLQTTTLDQITAPAASVSLNNQKITGLADATLATDALNLQTGDARYYLNTVTLDAITAPAGNVSMNNYRIVSLGDATASTDALNRQTGDARYYQSTVTLDAVTAPTSSVSLNSQKVTNLAAPTISGDGASKGYVDSNFYLNTTTLNAITAPSAAVSLNSQKITNLATPTLTGDGATKGYIDSNFYLNTTALNAITAPTAAVSLNSQKVTNLATPTANTDAATKAYVDTLITNITPYRFYINIGDVPSSVEGYGSDSSVITGVTYTNLSATTGTYTCAFSNPWGTDYIVILQFRSIRGSGSTLDNDIYIPIISVRTSSSFTIFLEESGSVVQNIAIDGIIMKSP